MIYIFVKDLLTLMKSKVFVSMTIAAARSCQIMRQKSTTVSSVGPWVTMYAFGFNILCGQNKTILVNLSSMKYSAYNCSRCWILKQLF